MDETGKSGPDPTGHVDTALGVESDVAADQVPSQRTPPDSTMSGTETVATAVPAQAEPDHDRFEYVREVPDFSTRLSDPNVPDAAHWVEHRKPRVVATSILAAATIGVVACLVVAITTQSSLAIGGLVACTVIAVVFRGALISSGICVVDLKGSTVKIQRDGLIDTFDLADPSHQVTLHGQPGNSDWRLDLEALNGEVIHLGPSEVDANQMHRVVLHYRRVAEQVREERAQRFRR